MKTYTIDMNYLSSYDQDVFLNFYKQRQKNHGCKVIVKMWNKLNPYKYLSLTRIK